MLFMYTRGHLALVIYTRAHLALVKYTHAHLALVKYTRVHLALVMYTRAHLALVIYTRAHLALVKYTCPSHKAPPVFDWYQFLLHVCDQLSKDHYLTAERPGIEPTTFELQVQHSNHDTKRRHTMAQ